MTETNAARFEVLAEAYFDQVIAPTLSVLTEKHQAKVYDTFTNAVASSSFAKVRLNLWALDNPQASDRGQHCYTSWCECLSSGERICLLCRQGRCPVEQSNSGVAEPVEVVVNPDLLDWTTNAQPKGRASESDAVQEDDRPVEFVHFVDAPPDDEDGQASGSEVSPS